VKRSRAWWQERSEVFLAACARLAEAEIGVDAVEAIFLCGSFASGEETIVLETEIPILLSDIDFVVVVKSSNDLRTWFPRRSDLGSACEALLSEVRFGGHVEVGVMMIDDLRRMPARPGVYDMKNRGRVLNGNAEILNHIPEYRASDITAREALLLIENRVISLLDSCPACSPGRGEEPYRFLYEVTRVYTDIAVAALSIAGCYIPGYIARRDLIRTKIETEKHSLLSILVSPEVLSKIDRSTRFKIDPSLRECEAPSDASSREGMWTGAAQDILRFWRQAVGQRDRFPLDLPMPVRVGALGGPSRNYREWRAHMRGWRSFLSRFPAARRILLAASLGKDLFATGPLDIVRKEGLRLLEDRLARGPEAPVNGCRFGFPHHAGRWENAAGELSSLWKEIVFGRRGA
jgi:predicted nucleotidyltransferase